MVYNLLDEQWIPVLYHDGTWERARIRKRLDDAGQMCDGWKEVAVYARQSK